MLEELALYKNDWIRFVSGYVTESIYREDIVQEMYLKAHRTKNQSALLTKEGKANKKYIFQMLKNMCVDYNRAKGRVIKEDLENVQHLEETPTYGMCIDDLKDINRKHHEIREKLRNAENGAYYERLYLIRTCADSPTYRQLSKETGIALTTLVKNINEIKEIVKAS